MKLTINVELREGMTRAQIFIALLECGRAAGMCIEEMGTPEVDEDWDLTQKQRTTTPGESHVIDATLFRSE